MSYPYEFALAAERNRNRLYDAVVEAIEEAAARDGITQSKIAEAMGRKPSQVSAWLSGPSNWTCDTVSDFLSVIKAEMEYTVVFNAGRQASNVLHPASIAPPDHTPVTVPSPAYITGTAAAVAFTPFSSGTTFGLSTGNVGSTFPAVDPRQFQRKIANG